MLCLCIFLIVFGIFLTSLRPLRAALSLGGLDDGEILTKYCKILLPLLQFDEIAPHFTEHRANVLRNDQILE